MGTLGRIINAIVGGFVVPEGYWPHEINFAVGVQNALYDQQMAANSEQTRKGAKHE